jgi:uncharacterized protein YjbI with pentapeptide repeats
MHLSEVPMIEPKLAPVRPRVTTPDSDGSSPLEDEVRARIDLGACAHIALIGPPGSGKTTALAHLAHIFADDSQLLLMDWQTSTPELDQGIHEQLVISELPYLTTPTEVWRIVPWGQDEYIEYLLTVHREQCDSVMRRLLADPERHLLAGRPELCCAVLDQLAGDAKIADVQSALGREISVLLPESAVRSAASLWSFVVMCHPEQEHTLAAALGQCEGVSEKACSFLRHAQVRILLATEHLVEQLRCDEMLDLLKLRLPLGLVRRAGAVICKDLQVRVKLKNVLAPGNELRHAMAASLLHAASDGWIPESGGARHLSGAYLAGACWTGIRLSELQLDRADLTNADLCEARLDSASARFADFSGARLHGARLKRFSAVRAALVNADLSFIRAPQADFRNANLREANLEGAFLRGTNFRYANLRGARCCRADFSNADLVDAEITEADFTGANLSRSNLRELVLRLSNFSGVQFTSAVLVECDLEFMRLPGANFEQAQLQRAFLTGSKLPDARFCGADLSSAHLADIEWERADLRDADLRGSTFHMGSSRSGLVGSPIASEGSRTGFYTDEFHEQEFKAPEEIRKANLCGADLRGAKIDGVDFYLVDLRAARYTTEQAEQFRRSGAILEARV